MNEILVFNIFYLTESKSKNEKQSRSMKPMTKEEWEKQQSVVRRVVDPETGRHR